AYKNGQLNITELSRVCDLSRTTIYKYISLLET
ncbi:MAG: winged helix-turn-helix transcriptional regulator, partial [Agathobacter sp.]